MAAIDGKIFLTHNDCYISNDKMKPQGIVVHSTGCNNPTLRRYIAPDDGVIGPNAYGNDWNRSGEDVCVHAFIGKDKNGKVKTYQVLPFDVCCWGCGGGWNGSYNYDPAYIQCEMCEDDLSNKAYCKAVYDKAVEFCAYLCKTFDIVPSKIVSHKEAHDLGYASDHGDPHNWWDKFGYTMDGFRKDVKDKLLNRVLKVKKNCYLYSAPYKDMVGGSVKSLAIKKGETVTFVSELSTKGWSSVSYKGKKYYIINSNLPLKLSGFKSVTFKTNRRALPVKGKLFGERETIKRGTVVQVIGLITEGTYKGYKLIKANKKLYYIKAK